MLAEVLLLALLWSLSHHYLGLGGDARLYAVQAFARVHPNLFHDLYLQNSSQDSYTLFSTLYAPCIRLIGLQGAALTLTVVFKVIFFAAAWVLARRLFHGVDAVWAVALLILIPGAYGAYGIFHYAEDWLTARSAAEALVVAAIACSLYGCWRAGLLIACGTMLLHPLIALPGLLWLVCLRPPLRLSAIGVAGLAFLALAVASISLWKPLPGHLFVLMDPAWIEVVRERSQFLFVELWRPNDWSLNARPFLSLLLSVLAVDDRRVRKFGVTAMLVGASGLALAFIATLLGPISILLQGQAWRWVWVTSFASVILLASTLRALWRAEGWGPLCIPLAIFGWTFPPIGGVLCLGSALVLWLARDLIKDRDAEFRSGLQALLNLISVAQAGAREMWITGSRQAILPWFAMAGLFAACLYCLPRALHDAANIFTAAEIADYSDWRGAIAPEANVLVYPVRNSAAFAWFILQRPSYLTVDQSSGVVFSRATALEVRRRSQVLLPLMDPDWRILSDITQAASGAGSGSSLPHPLAREGLTSACRDPQLNFVVAAENIGFRPLRQPSPGGRQYWYLYDCRVVNDAHPSVLNKQPAHSARGEIAAPRRAPASS